MMLTTVDDRCVRCTRGGAVFQRSHGEVIGPPPPPGTLAMQNNKWQCDTFSARVVLFLLGHWYPKLSPFCATTELSHRTQSRLHY